MKKYHYDVSFEAASEKEAEMKAFSLSMLLPKGIAERKTSGLMSHEMPELRNVCYPDQQEINLLCFVRKMETVGKILQRLSEDATLIDAVADLLGVKGKKEEVYFKHPNE